MLFRIRLYIITLFILFFCLIIHDCLTIFYFVCDRDIKFVIMYIFAPQGLSLQHEQKTCIINMKIHEPRAENWEKDVMRIHNVV